MTPSGKWLLLAFAIACAAPAAELERVRVAANQRSFELTPSGRAFVPWGFNYDHDRRGRLLEDYWDDEWATVEEDFAEMKALGANVVRIHLQTGKFLDDLRTPNEHSLAKLRDLVRLAERTGLYLDLTGLGCYHKQDVPAWYDALPEAERWAAQGRFWEAVAETCAASPAVFCYDLMNEPVVPGAKRGPDEWLGGAFAGKHFVQFIALDPRGRARPDIARDWVRTLVTAIRKHDRGHLVTVGLVDWSLDRPGLTSGFVPARVAPDLDFVCVHLYPERGRVEEALTTLRGFAVGKPVLIEETFTLRCGLEEFADFVTRSRAVAAGHVGFYWGQRIDELEGKSIADAILKQWLEFFREQATKPR